jgi:hypothetical protein
MKFVMLVYQGSTPLPGSDRWQSLPEPEQKAIYADYVKLNKNEAVAPGLPLGLPHASRTAQVRNGKTQVKNGTYLGRRGRILRVRSGEHGSRDRAGCADSGGRLGGAVETKSTGNHQ